MGNWRFHPACLLFPPLSDEELGQLADDIKRRGLLHPIITHEDKILDGRNRLAACKIAGVEPRFEKWKEAGSPVQWAISTNLHRRHLTASQKAALALDILPMLEQEAKKRQRLSAGRGIKVAKELATNNGKGKSSQFAAKLVGTNSAYIETVKSVKRRAPSLVKQIRNGVLTVAEANRISKLETYQRDKFFQLRKTNPEDRFTSLIKLIVRRPAAPLLRTNGKGTIEIWCGDCIKLMKDYVAAESIDAICTSPPFNRGLNYGECKDDLNPEEYEKWLDEVFTQFARSLKSTGSVFLIVGHSPRHPCTAFEMARIAAKHFTLQNQIVWLKSISLNGASHGHFTPIPGSRYLNRNWDFVFHFSKTGNAHLDRKAVGVPFVDKNNSVRAGDGDDVRCDGDVWFVPFETIHDLDERGQHPATFPPAVAERCLKLAGCNKDSQVLDPFCGVNGMVAASRLGLNGTGIDLNLRYCRNAARLAGGNVVAPRRNRSDG